MRRPEFLMMRRPQFLMMRRPAQPQKSGSIGLYITTYQSVKNTLNLDGGHRGFPKTLLDCILSSTVDLYSIALLTEVLKAHVHYVVAGSHLPYISISYT